MAAVFDSLKTSAGAQSSRARSARRGAMSSTSRLWGVIRDWLLVLGPTAAILVLALTVFLDATLGSINSLSGSGLLLVYLIIGVYFFGVVLVILVMVRFTAEGSFLARWRAASPVAREAMLANGRSASLAKPLYLALQSEDLSDPGLRQSRLDRELDDLRDRLGEGLAFPNFVIGALVGLGLFGTFVGLIGTLEDLGKLFQALMTTGGKDVNPVDVFADMVRRLQAPMASMATAFVTSLYGLGGSLMLGLAVLMAGKVAGRMMDDGYAELVRTHQGDGPRSAPVVLPAAPDHETLQLELRLRAEQWRVVLDDLRELQEGHARETAALRDGISDVAQSTHDLALAVRQRLRLDEIRTERARRGGVAVRDTRRQDQDLERRINRSKTSIDAWNNENVVEIRPDLAQALTRLSMIAAEQEASLRTIAASLEHVEQLLGHAMKRQLSVTLTVDPTRDGGPPGVGQSSA